MPAHARRGCPIKTGTRVCQETGGAALQSPVRHVRVSAPRVDELVQLPALIRQRPRLECLLDRRTLPGRQVLGGLALPRPIGGLLGSRRGIVRPHGHPVPSPPGGFPLHTKSHSGVDAPSRLTPSRPRCYVLGHYIVLQYPRVNYTDLDNLICKRSEEEVSSDAEGGEHSYAACAPS